LSIHVPVRTRFVRTIETVDPFDLQSLVEKVLGEHPELSRRMLIIAPSETLAQRLQRGFQTVGINSSVCSRSSPFAMPTGIICATSIVDVGVTVEPPAGILIDSGLQHVLFPSNIAGQDATGQPISARSRALALDVLYNHVNLYSSKNNAEQRAGRVARNVAGIVYRPVYCGTGPETIPAVNFSILLGLSVPEYNNFNDCFEVDGKLDRQRHEGLGLDFVFMNTEALTRNNVRMIYNHRHDIMAGILISLICGGRQAALAEVFNAGFQLTENGKLLLKFMGPYPFELEHNCFDLRAWAFFGFKRVKDDSITYRTLPVWDPLEGSILLI